MVESRRSACSAVLATLVLSLRRVQASPSTTPGALLPRLGLLLYHLGGHQGKLGYENRPTYDYLARSQARNWPYPASRCGRALGV